MADEMDDAAKNAGDMGGKIDDAGEKAEKSGGKFEKLGSVLKGIGTAMGAVAAAAGAAAVKLGKEVVSAYADYEQLVGGVDTLFKDNSKELQSYAANAYKTAGLSANEYMETVTSFSASLIQSLGGDTEKAVKYADMAITDMSDNANKMGTDMSMIQSAYQGFAKQNYTMLDNLKLGYGGTKSEMERLLADAEAISGIHYNLESYADVVDAIHVIQTSMDITANTSRELKPSSSSTSYPFYLGTSSLYWHYAYLGSVQVKIGSSNSSRIGFFSTSPIARQTLSTYSQNMGYSSASSSNYLKILNNLVGILRH